MTKTIKINVSVSTGYVGCGREDVIEIFIDDEMTEEEIENAKNDAAREWMFEQIEWGWSDIN